MKTSFTHGNFSKYLYNKESVLPKSRVLINLHKEDDDDDDNLYSVSGLLAGHHM